MADGFWKIDYFCSEMAGMAKRAKRVEDKKGDRINNLMQRSPHKVAAMNRSSPKVACVKTDEWFL